MTRYLAIFASALALSACAVDASTPEFPAWLQARIAQFEEAPRASPPRAILRTTYAGRPAYYVTPTCCDIPSELYDDAGQLLCYPSGGFAGGDGRCPAFSLPPNSVTVWRDSRPAQARTK